MHDTTTDQAPFVERMSAEWRARSCARCDHRSDEHRWNGARVTDVRPPVPCMAASCTCESWTFEPKRGQKA